MQYAGHYFDLGNLLLLLFPPHLLDFLSSCLLVCPCVVFGGGGSDVCQVLLLSLLLSAVP